eukprot:5189271-Karenia_brevis.AAC.1
MDISSIYMAMADFQVLRCCCRAADARRPFFDVSLALPNGSLHKECMVSPPSNRAAAFEGANFCTVSGPAKYVMFANFQYSCFARAPRSNDCQTKIGQLFVVRVLLLEAVLADPLVIHVLLQPGSIP